MSALQLSHHAQQSLAQFLRSWLKFRIVSSDIPGISIAIRCGEENVFVAAEGFADVEKSEPLTSQHTLEIASQTKMFTSLTLVLMHKRNVLNMFDPVTTYLPMLASATDIDFDDVTVYDLLTHQSGVPREFFVTSKEFVDPIEAMIATLKETGAVHKPCYSNAGYALLAAVVESAASVPYEAAVHDYVLAPLHLQDTNFGDSGKALQAHGYRYQVEQERQVVARLPNPLATGAMGVLSTPADMCVLAGIHFSSNTAFLDIETKKLLQSMQWGYSSQSGFTEFALGFESRWVKDKRFLGHSGGAEGFTSATYFHPDDEVAVSVSLNCRDPKVLGDVSAAIVEALYFFAKNASSEPGEDRLKYSGRFRGDVSLFEIVSTSNCIAMVDPLAWNPFGEFRELVEVAPNVLEVKGNDFNYGGTRLRYSSDNGTPVVSMGPFRLSSICCLPSEIGHNAEHRETVIRC